VIGALGGKPLLLQGEHVSIEGASQALQGLDTVQRHMQVTLLRRALAKVEA
jgi:stress-induced morphogen